MGGLNVTWLVKDVGTWGCLQQAQTVHGLDGAPQMILHCVSFGKKPQGCGTAPSATGTDEMGLVSKRDCGGSSHFGMILSQVSLS